MCGLSACWIWRSEKQTDLNDQTKASDDLYVRLDRSAEIMRHRGPDAKGVWIAPDASVGLGHVRLATRDLSDAGNQPLHNCSTAHDVHVVVNGEIYFDHKFRADLAREYTFQSRSDSELVIPLYQRYGASFVSHLRGEFALVLYDGKSQTLIAARDRFGVKPLHYGIFDGQLLIATQIKGITSMFNEGRAVEWDLCCIPQGCGLYGNRTLFRGINKLSPGHILVVHQDQKGSFSSEPYYRSSYPAIPADIDTRPSRSIINELRTRLLEAVRLRLESSDVPIGVLLSGGIDSSAIAGMAAYLTRERQKKDSSAPELPTCFTIRFSDEEFDESHVACRTAVGLGLPIEVFTVDEQELVGHIEESCWLGEVPLWDLQHVAKKALCKYISDRGFKVVLSGDGSDEFFGGYSFFVSDRFYDEHSSGTMNKSENPPLAQEVAWYGLHDSVGRDNDAAKILGLPPAFSEVGISRHDAWLTDEIRELSNPYQAIKETFTSQELDEMTCYHPLHRAMLAWEKTFLPNAVIAAVADGAEMAHSVESRPPFLDHKVAELTHQLPVDMLVHDNDDERPTEKWVLRQAVRPFVSEEVYRRKKQPFAAPFRWRMNGPLHQKISTVVTHDSVRKLGFVDWAKCEGIVDKAFAQEDGRLFRQVIWLAQLILIGQHFDTKIPSSV